MAPAENSPTCAEFLIDWLRSHDTDRGRFTEVSHLTGMTLQSDGNYRDALASFLMSVMAQNIQRPHPMDLPPNFPEYADVPHSRAALRVIYEFFTLLHADTALQVAVAAGGLDVHVEDGHEAHHGHPHEGAEDFEQPVDDVVLDRLGQLFRSGHIKSWDIDMPHGSVVICFNGKTAGTTGQVRIPLGTIGIYSAGLVDAADAGAKNAITLDAVDPLYWGMMADLARWGCVAAWGRIASPDGGMLTYTIADEQFNINGSQIPDEIGGLMNGWLAARRLLPPEALAPGELDAIEQRLHP